MKPLTFMLAALGMVSSAAGAQSALTIYGVADSGIVYERGGPDGNATRLSGGVQSGSRLGFRAIEDLGGGLMARLVLESGFNTDTGALGQGGLLFGRQAYAGLGGRWGELNLGRQESPHFLALDAVDPFGTGLAGNATNLMATTPRMNNTIKISTPTWSGLVGEFAYGLGEVPGDTRASRQLGASVGYAGGPLVVRLAHHRAENALGTDHASNTLLAGRYNFGIVAASVGVGMTHGLGAADNRDYLLGLSVPVGPGSVLASYIHKDDRSAGNANADQLAIGYSYSLSRRTNVYSSFALIHNEPGARYTVGNATDPGSGDRAFNIGIRHKF